MESKVAIKIPPELYWRLGQMTAGTGYSSVNEFIVFAMRTVASGGEIKGEDRLTAEEVRSIREIEETGLLEGGRWKKRQRALGYLD